MIQIVLSLGITFCEEGRLLCSLLTFCQLVGISWPSKQETLPNSFITSKPKLFLTLWWLFSRSVESYSATPWTAAHQASLSFTISRSLLKLTSIESMLPSNHLILCRPLFLMPSISSYFSFVFNLGSHLSLAYEVESQPSPSLWCLLGGGNSFSLELGRGEAHWGFPILFQLSHD